MKTILELQEELEKLMPHNLPVYLNICDYHPSLGGSVEFRTEENTLIDGFHFETLSEALERSIKWLNSYR